jgi:hypothetical protein
MIPTRDLIALLAAGATPVRRLRRPELRAASWLGLAAVVVAMLIVGQGVRPDIWKCVCDVRFDLALSGALLTGVTGALATFMLSLPDRSRWWALVPVPPLALWLSSIGYQCLTNWITFDPAGMHWGETARCFATLVLASLPLSLAMLVMIRYAAPLRPTLATLTASLAVSAFTAVAMFVIHDLDASLMVLMWGVFSTGLMVGLGCLFGRRMLMWAATRIGPERA